MPAPLAALKPEADPRMADGGGAEAAILPAPAPVPVPVLPYRRCAGRAARPPPRIRARPLRPMRYA